ncbi:MAG: hypothetical protein JWR80_7473 [Bradyrhizobium sp.]|nr:hypothetical protein [Bradyrhizobium sp.]
MLMEATATRPQAVPAPGPYLLHAWYLAAWDHELNGVDMLARRICSERLVLVKKADGVAALRDACPHRFAPLSLGAIIEDGVQCAYHGLRFGMDGGCTHNPHGPVTSAMRVRAFPAIRAYRGIWVWMGDAERADPALLPDLACLDAEPADHADKGGYIHGQADYRLYTDNIMDLSHVDYLHAAANGDRSVTGAKQQVIDDGATLRVSWVQRGHEPQPLEIQLGIFEPGISLDRYGEICWMPPGVMKVTMGIGIGDAPPETSRIGIHIMTPEDVGTTHYFWVFTRGKLSPEDEAFHAKINAERERVFVGEDSAMLQAVQDVMGGADLFALKPILLRTDEAAVRVRRKLDAMIVAQGQEPSVLKPAGG